MSGSISDAELRRGVIAYSAIRAAGFPDPRVALQVAYAESSWDPKQSGKNKNGSVDYGLFQINSIHKPPENVKTDPVANAKFAKKVYDDAKGWRPWVAYTTGRYKKAEAVSNTNAVLEYVKSPAGAAAVAASVIPSGGDSSDTNLVGDVTDLGLKAAGAAQTLINPLDALDTMQAGVKNALEWAKEAFSMFLMFLLGVICILAGIYMVAREPINKAIGKAAGGLISLTPVGKGGKVLKAVSTVSKAAGK